MLTDYLVRRIPFDPLCTLVPASNIAASIEQKNRVIADALN